MGKLRDTLTFKDVVDFIPDEEIQILKHLWDYFLENEKWPSGKSFRSTNDRVIVDKTIDDLSPFFIMYHKTASPGKYHSELEYYELTLEGLFAIEGSEGENIKLIIQYLDYQKEKFNEDAEVKEVKAEKFSEYLGRSIQDIQRIKYYINMSCFGLLRSSLNDRDNNWTAGVINEIEKLNEINDSHKFLMKMFNKSMNQVKDWNRNKDNFNIIDRILIEKSNQTDTINTDLFVEKSIDDYLKNENTDYAILITGNWGIGKSFYIKKDIAKRDKNENIEEGNNYRQIYVSLYGISKITEIDERIFYEVYSFLNEIHKHKKISEISKIIINVLGSIKGIKASDMSISFNKFIDYKKYILFFDDIERINISPIVLLGYINNFVENDRMKVILIGNENRLNILSDSDLKKYKEIKEKTIRKTIEFKQCTTSVIKDIIKKYEKGTKEYYEYLISKENDIIKHFRIRSYYNLRIFIQSLEEFKAIFKIIKVELTNKHLDFLLNLFMDLLFLNFKEDNDKLKKEIYNYYTPYLKENNKIYNTLDEYIKTGYLDDNDIKKEIDIILKSIIINEDKRENNKLESIDLILGNFEKLDDNEFNKASKKAYLNMKNGDIPIIKYPILFTRFEYFINYGIFSKKRSILLNDFKEGLEKSYKNNNNNYNIDENVRLLPPFGNYSKECDEIFELTKKYGEKLIEKKYAKEIDKILNEGFCEYIKKNRNKMISLVSIIDINSIFDFLKKCKNNKDLYCFKTELINLLNDEKICSKLSQLANRIYSYIEGKDIKHSIKYYHLKLIANTIEERFNEIEKKEEG
jgi:hypothetical protein